MPVLNDIERQYGSAPGPRQPDLFTSFAERVQLRVGEVLANRACRWPVSSDQRALLYLLQTHCGRANAMPLGEICERLRLTPRTVKDLVQDLRLNFGLQIGASREASAGGYYLGTSREEMVESSTQMFHQAITMLRVVQAMRAEHDAEELLGQIRLSLTAPLQEKA